MMVILMFAVFTMMIISSMGSSASPIGRPRSTPKGNHRDRVTH
jgi:hypothetical protein